MKRLLAAAVLLLLMGAVLYGVVVYRQEQGYRVLLAEGEAALAVDDTYKAIEAFSGAIALNDGAMVGYLKRGEAYRRRNELEAALRDLRRAIDIDPLAPRAFELLGDVYFALGRFDRAAGAYQSSVDLDDRSGRVLYKLALADYRGAQPARAQEALRKAIAVEDRFAEAYYLLGLCARDLQNVKEALAALERSVLLAPALLPAREELGSLYGRLGRPDDRISQLEALRALEPSPSREVALGLAYARAGRTEAAVQTLGRAAERFPDHHYTYVALGRVWLEVAEPRGDRVALSKALGALEGAVGTDHSSEALMLFGRALLLAGDAELAERMLEQATERMPVDPLAFFYLAEAAERRGHLAAARDALRDYHALEGDDPDARRRAALASRLAGHAARTGEHAMAVAWLQRAIDAAGADSALLLRLAESQERNGDTAAARATVARLLEQEPRHRGALTLLRRIQG